MSPRTITKSIRLTPEESAELSRLSEQSAATEAALMKQWIRDGINAHKLDLALRAYMERQVDVRGTAAMGGVSYNRMLRELQNRGIVILEGDQFLDRMLALADAFDDKLLQTSTEKMLSD